MAIFLLKLATAFLVLSIVSGKNIRPFLKEDYLIPDGWRPGRPYLQDGLPSQMSLHHIVPYGTLRKFYNTVLQRAIPKEVNDLGTGLKSVLQRLKQAKKFGNEYEKKALRSVVISNNSVDFCDMLINYKDTTDPDHWIPKKASEMRDGFEQTVEYYAWTPGNLFIGPSDRSDDPGDNFEINSCRLIAPEQFTLLASVDKLMGNYAAQPAGPGNFRDTSEVATKMDKIASHRPIIYKYDDSKWVRPKNYPDKYSIARSETRRCVRA